MQATASDDWFSYGGGVFSSDQCGGTLNHAVLVVSAGIDATTGKPYWLIRNRCAAIHMSQCQMFRVRVEQGR